MRPKCKHTPLFCASRLRCKQPPAPKQKKPQSFDWGFNLFPIKVSC
ncbi:hypothetical protein IFVP177_C1170128 [Vibrio parahaemolyticus]